MLTYLWVAIGGALGSMARYWMGGAVAAITGPEFPWGTILINIVGSFVIGVVAALSGPDSRVAVPGDIRAFIMVGICGGYTTFSAFSLQTLELARGREWLQVGGNIVLSVVLCLIAVWLGYKLGAVLGSLEKQS